jgi:hypothetical protein
MYRRPPRYLRALVGVFPAKDVASGRQPRWGPGATCRMRSSRLRFARAERCMNDERSHARAWLAKAESDRLAARRLLDAGGPFDAVCFHAQQACEKALKRR